MLEQAFELLRESEQACEEGDCVKTIEYALQAINITENNIENVDSGEIVRKSLELISEVLVRIWSAGTDDFNQDDLDKLLESSVSALNTADNFAKNENVLDLNPEIEQLENVIGNLDEIWIKEQMLTKQLVESEQIKPEKISKILHKLAKLQTKRTPEKRDLLYTCALLQSALTTTDSDSRSILRDIRRLNEALLTEASANAKEVKLYEVSREIYDNHIAKLQDDLLKILDSFESPEPDSQVKTSDTEKTEPHDNNIRHLFENLYNGYTEALRAVSDKCVEILGASPCKFTHIAMGALSRHQMINLDELESMILLESDVKKQDNFHEILKYFHSYSRIFQAILIYFGLCPFEVIGICLDDIYQPEYLKLGRNTRKAITIQTVKEASKEMFSKKEVQDQDIEFAYKITHTSCFGGSEGLHRKFQKRLRKNIKEDPTQFQNLVLRSIEGSFTDFSFKNVISDDMPFADLNSPFAECSHETALQFVQALGHLAHVESNSIFETCDKLFEREILSENAHYQIKAAIDLSLEMKIRFKFQRKDFHSLSCIFGVQDSFADITEIYNKIGKSKMMQFVLTTSDLQKTIAKIGESPEDPSSLRSYTLDTQQLPDKVEIFLYLSLFDDALECMKSHDANEHSAPSNAFIYFLKGLCLTKIRKRDEAIETLSVCLAIILSLPEADQPKIIQYVHYLIGKNMVDAQRLFEAKDHLFQAKQNVEVLSMSSHKLQGAVFRTLVDLYYLAGEFRQAAESCEEYFTLSGGTVDKGIGDSVLLQRYGNSLFELGRYTQSAEVLQKSLQLHKSHLLHQDSPDTIESGTSLKILISLRECFMKLNRLDLAEEYCKDCINEIELLPPSKQGDLAQAKLVLSQSFLKQSKYKEASESACEAFLTVVNDEKNSHTDVLSITQATVNVVMRCVKSLTSTSADVEVSREDIRISLECASHMFDTMCKQIHFVNHQLERDKSILIRVIQKGLYDLNAYDCLLDCFKQTNFTKSKSDGPSSNLLHKFVDIIISNDKLREHCEKDCDRLCNMGKYCNVRDSFSPFGAVIVYAGWMLLAYKKYGSERSIIKSLEKNLLEESSEKQTVLLHCAVKMSKFLIDLLVDKFKKSSTISNPEEHIEPLKLATDIYGMIVRQHHPSERLLDETINLIVATSECWMKLQGYEAALELLNEALSLKEKLAISSPVYLDTKLIIQNIGICLAKLNRWDEAKDYLNRDTQMKETRRKSRAVEDSSILQIRVKSAQCSYDIGNYTEAALLASEAFHEALGSDNDKSVTGSMILSANIVLKSGLATSVHSHVESETDKTPKEVVRSVLDCLVTMRVTLTDHSDRLGSAFSEMIESFYYASGNCFYVLNEHDSALKCFKKSLRILKKRGQFTGLERSLNLQIAKCFLGMHKYKKADKKLREFLDMGEDKTSLLHSHPSHAYVLLAMCAVKRHKHKLGFTQVRRAIKEAHGQNSEVLLKQITKLSAKIVLESLMQVLESPMLD